MNKRLVPGTCLLLIMLALPGHASEIEVVTEDSSYAYLSGGKLAGPGTHVVEQTLKHAAVNDYRILLYPWARAYEKALREPNVLIFPILRTTARESQFKWVGEIAQAQTMLYKLREQTDLTLESISDARRYIIGVVRDDSRQAYLEGRGFKRLVVSTTNRDSFQKLLHHQVELLPMTEREVRLLSEQAQVDVGRLEAVAALGDVKAGIYMAFSLETPDEMVNLVRTAFEQLKASGEIERLMHEEP
ncbi:ABC transporter substrate-binding protein [Pseudomonas sp. v388]|uniref:substrate-binding periplasmic protein n=1 Tax=Pseudomonas sp. v388 TaxID=2479849 RepID=UPI000F7A5AC1|nr:transporter substrate-binding domain-containing protein [Pseudomonas sp. v388]RRV03749.1 ABC transporter substrate-binding protein [Pseudomonas sp. v388]